MVESSEMRGASQKPLIVLCKGMAAVAAVLTDMASLFAQAPATNSAWSAAVAQQWDTPKKMAERIISTNDAANRAWLRRYRLSVEGVISLNRDRREFPRGS
mgnify:CR=1 FL=1